MPVAPLTALPNGARALIDANIFIYAAGGKSLECEVFLVRCARREVRGVTTVEVLAEVSHRRMVAEAFEDGLIPREAASYLQAKRTVVAGLRRYQAFINEILDSNLLILGLDEERFGRSGSLRSLHGLLTNDSLILAAAESYGIASLATRDDDFDDVPWLTVYKPRDIP